MSRWSLVLMIPVLALLPSACTPPSEEAAAATSPEATERPASLVETATLETTEFVERIELNGVTEPVRTAEVRAQVGGRIVSLDLTEGEPVEAGDTVMVLNASQGRATVDRMEVERDQLDSDIERTERLVRRGLSTEAELERLRSQRSVVAESIAEVQVGMRETRHRAPIGGTVTEVWYEQGEFCGQGDPVARIVDISTIVVEVGLPEREIAHVSEGQAVEVRIEALDETVPGVIHRIGLEASPSSRTFPLEIYVDNPDGRLRAGMRATAIITKAVYPAAVVVPRDALIQTVSGSEVFLVEDGTAVVHGVEPGPGLGRFVLVDGVEAGQELVVRGHRALVQGEPVEITRTEACCDAQFREYRFGPPEPGEDDSAASDDDVSALQGLEPSEGAAADPEEPATP